MNETKRALLQIILMRRLKGRTDDKNCYLGHIFTAAHKKETNAAGKALFARARACVCVRVSVRNMTCMAGCTHTHTHAQDCSMRVAAGGVRISSERETGAGGLCSPHWSLNAFKVLFLAHPPTFFYFLLFQ